MTTKVINLFCLANRHADCPGESAGNAADPESFECICRCHDQPRIEKWILEMDLAWARAHGWTPHKEG